MKKQSFFSMRLNGLSVIMMLILLCLTVFGVLSLVSANAELKLSQKNATHIASYAKCDAEAQLMLSTVYSAAQVASTTDEFSEILGSAFTIIRVEELIKISFNTPKTELISIIVELSVDTEKNISVTKYQIHITATENSTKGEIWQG